MSSTLREDLQAELEVSEVADFGEALAKVDVAFALAQARILRGVKQEDLAAKLSTTQSYIAKLERGDANPSIARVGKFLALLGFRLSVGVVPLNPQQCAGVVRPAEGSSHMSRSVGERPRYSASSTADVQDTVVPEAVCAR